MAQKKVPAPAPSKSAKPSTPAKAVASTSPVRKTAIPPAPVPSRKKEPVISFDQIAKRAYEIHISGHGGSQDDNWHRAERELRGR